MDSLQRNLSWFFFLPGSVAGFVAGKHAPRSAFILSVAVCAALTVTHSLAADYPDRPIRLIVPSAPGGGPDIYARLIGNEIGKQMGQQVVVDNRPGANGIIGFEVLARAAPDGYTLGFMTNPFITNPSIYLKLPYDSARDFQPVIFQGSSTFLLTVTPSLPIHSVKDLIEHARANPGTLSYGMLVKGGPQHLAVELLKIQTGTNIVPVGYKGVQQAIIDVVGGQIHIVCDNILSILPHVRSGKLRGLGVTSLKRSPAVPELPSIAEAGIPGYEMTPLDGYLVPAQVPREIVMRLNSEINKALQLPTVTERFAANGGTIGGGTPEQYAEHIRSQTAKWANVIKAAGIKPE